MPLKSNSSYIAACKIFTTDGWITLTSVYIPPTVKRKEIITSLTHLIRTSTATDQEQIICCGDFNGRSTQWGDEKTNANGLQVEEMLEANQLVPVNHGKHPTFSAVRSGVLHKSIVDLTCVSPNLLAQSHDWKVRADSSTTSDHYAITFELSVKYKFTAFDSTKVFKQIPKSWRNFENIATQKLDSVHRARECSVEILAARYTRAATETADYTIRKSQKQMSRKCFWKNSTIVALDRRINALRRSISVCSNSERRDSLRKRLTELRSEVSSHIKEAKLKSWRDYTKQLDASKTWDPVNKWLKNSSVIQSQCLTDSENKFLSAADSGMLLLNTFFLMIRNITIVLNIL
ncbi:uncharacterized protein LOC128389985 [Panonychus citri]|uniref:uncharacterized protein LOC128389985 n=1 Tax=Panonychus citri TaxID=50023 RepID=UPI0023072CEC|nr:uncharacterized protein LOC128389985 [Panonychus citri]